MGKDKLLNSSFDRFERMSNSQLVECLFENDEKAILYFFYKKYYSVFEKQIYRIFDYKVDVQELVDEFFLYLLKNDWKHLRTYDSQKGALNKWVSRVAYLFFVNYKKTQMDNNGNVSIDDHERWNDRIMQYRQDSQSSLKMDVIKAINHLKNKDQREVARRLLIEEHDIKDIASDYGWTVDYAYVVKNRALKQLRDFLRDYKS